MAANITGLKISLLNRMSEVKLVRGDIQHVLELMTLSARSFPVLSFFPSLSLPDVLGDPIGGKRPHLEVRDLIWR